MTDEESKTVKVCKSFVTDLLGADRTQFDNCGLNFPGIGVALPSNLYNSSDESAEEFLNALRPPFFEEYKFEIWGEGSTIDGRACDDGDDCCFTSFGLRVAQSSALFTVAAAVVTMLLSERD